MATEHAMPTTTTATMVDGDDNADYDNGNGDDADDTGGDGDDAYGHTTAAATTTTILTVTMETAMQ